MDKKDLDTLEGIIDAYTLGEVLQGLSEIAQAKAIHIEDAWQDKSTARPWWKVAGRLGTLSQQTDV